MPRRRLPRRCEHTIALMRTAAYCFVLVACAAQAQTSENLRSHHGQPYAEKFLVRPGIAATLLYGSDAAACQILIEKQPSSSAPAAEQKQQYMRPEIVTEIIDELVPVKDRGPVIGHSYEQMGCARGDMFTYTNVSISRRTDECAPLKPEREAPARITFKRPVCKSLGWIKEGQ